MTQQKKKNFGLAALLTQPRLAATTESPPAPMPPDVRTQPSEPPTSARVDVDDGVSEPAESRSFGRSDHTNHTKRRSAKEKKPGAPSREGGYIRRTITLGPALSDYVDRAWRTYRTPGGKYVKGVSGFIEAVIDEHRHRAK
jgi:hypothetical protein